VLRLATLPPLAYDQVREAEAKTLRVRVATLDAAVAGARTQLRARVRGPAETHPAGVPEGFALRQGGVFALGGGDGPDLHVCGPLEVVAVTHDGTGRAHGRLLRWRDGDGRLHEWCMPMTLLAGDGTELRARLLDEGLFVGAGARAREALGRYLGTAAPESTVRIAALCGWHGADGARVFVLPDRCFGPGGAPEMRLQTDRPDALPPRRRAARSRSGVRRWPSPASATPVWCSPSRRRSRRPC
jgi:hypothetical protein